MPLTQTCLASKDPYQRKGGLMCLAVLAEGCADHIRTKYVQLMSIVCFSLVSSTLLDDIWYKILCMVFADRKQQP